MGARFAVETGPETAAVLKGFLDSLHSRGVSVNLDPASLVMVTGDDPVRAVHTLKDYIIHTHAKDGVKLYARHPEKVYGLVRDDARVSDPSFRETPLGEGSVDYPAYLNSAASNRLYRIPDNREGSRRESRKGHQKGCQLPQ